MPSSQSHNFTLLLSLSLQASLTCSSFQFINNKHKNDHLGFYLSLPDILLSILSKGQLSYFLELSDFFFCSPKNHPFTFFPLQMKINLNIFSSLYQYPVIFLCQIFFIFIFFLPLFPFGFLTKAGQKQLSKAGKALWINEL